MHKLFFVGDSAVKRRFNRYQRATARLAVVQMLFAEQHGELGDQQDAILNFFQEDWEKPDLHFMHDRFKSICKNSIPLEARIKDGLRKGWSSDRVDSVLHAILIAASDEMINGNHKTPVEILVKEYVDLAADFFNKSEIAFVNAYLNDLKHTLATANTANSDMR